MAESEASKLRIWNLRVWGREGRGQLQGFTYSDLGWRAPFRFQYNRYYSALIENRSSEQS